MLPVTIHNDDVPQEITVMNEPLDLFGCESFEHEMRYRDLKKVYKVLLDRHKDILRDVGDPVVPVPIPDEDMPTEFAGRVLVLNNSTLRWSLREQRYVVERPYTEINGVDFATPIETLDENAPFPIDCIANRFGTLVWNMLRACESGSIGGDAYRMQLVLEAAVEDTIQSISIHDDLIEHLLGLTMAIVRHGVGPFLDRGDPEIGQRLFKKIAHEWKKFFERHPVVYDLSMEFHKFAKVYGFEMQKMLKSSGYNFNFIRIPRKRKPSSSSEKEKKDPSSSSKQKKAKHPTKMEVFMERVNAVEGVPSSDDLKIYDSCTEVRSKIRAFLDRDGVTKKALCRALGDMNHNSLNQFLNAQGQKRAGTIAYKQAYVFFEKLRILEGEPKSFDRLRNEAKLPEGFSCEPEKGGRPSSFFYDPRLPLYTRSEVSF